MIVRKICCIREPKSLYRSVSTTINIEVDNILHPVLVDGTISDIHIPRMIIPRI